MGSSPISRFGRISRGGLVFVSVLAACGSGCGKREKKPIANARPDTTTTSVLPPASKVTGPLAGNSDPRLANPDYVKSLPPSAERDIAIGNAFFQQGNMDTALNYYQSAARRDPKSIAAWNFVGITLSRLERLTEAEAAYKKAIAIDAFYPKTHSNLGNLYLRRNMYDQAIAAFQRASSIDSTDTVNWLNTGLAYKKKGDINGAIVSYRKAAECDPQDAEPWSRLGYIYAEKMLYRSARESWHEAVLRDSTRIDLINNIHKLEAYAESTGTP